LDPIIR